MTNKPNEGQDAAIKTPIWYDPKRAGIINADNRIIAAIEPHPHVAEEICKGYNEFATLNAGQPEAVNLLGDHVCKACDCPCDCCDPNYCGDCSECYRKREPLRYYSVSTKDGRTILNERGLVADSREIVKILHRCAARPQAVDAGPKTQEVAFSYNLAYAAGQRSEAARIVALLEPIRNKPIEVLKLMEELAVDAAKAQKAYNDSQPEYCTNHITGNCSCAKCLEVAGRREMEVNSSEG